MRCETALCKKHPNHGRDHIAIVGCWEPGVFRRYPDHYVKSSVVAGEATCANYEECHSCPVCKPLPEWAKEAGDGLQCKTVAKPDHGP